MLKTQISEVSEVSEVSDLNQTKAKRESVELAILRARLVPEEEINTLEDLKEEILKRARAEELLEGLQQHKDCDNAHLITQPIPVLDMQKINIRNADRKGNAFLMGLFIFGLILV